MKKILKNKTANVAQVNNYLSEYKKQSRVKKVNPEIEEIPVK